MTERLLVRAPTEDDLPAYQGHFLQPEIERWLRPAPLPPFDRPQVRDLLDRDRLHWVDHGFGPWVLEDGESGEFVGRAGLSWTEVEDVLAVELPWSIEPSRQGRGLATEAACRALDEAHSLGFDHVVALILPHNSASRRVAEKAGMEVTGEADHAGLPHVVYRAKLRR